MSYLTDEESRVLRDFGERLKARRIDRGDTQSAFAARVGVSVPTYRKMEKGEDSVPFGYWVRALRLLGALGQLDELLPVSLLSQSRGRQRARRRQRTDRQANGDTE